MYAARRPLAQPANLQAERDKSGACSTASKVLFGGDNASPRPALNQCLIETSHLRAKCDRKRAHGDWGIAWRFFCAARRFLFAHRTPPGADSFICRERVQSVPGAFGRFVFIAVDGSAPHLRCFACATRTFCSAHIVYLCVVSFYSPNRPPAPPPPFPPGPRCFCRLAAAFFAWPRDRAPIEWMSVGHFNVCHLMRDAP